MSTSAAIFPNLDQAAAKTNGSAPTGSVLLVEDDESLADLLKHLLTRMQVRVVHAPTAALGVKALGEHRSHISLAIVDCHLPDSEGGELCRQLRELVPGLPLLLSSGRDQRALEATFSATGPCSFLAKPYMPADVMGRVKSMLLRKT
jgi:two-component system, cell cycle sensor histidine kinase and response regulator CckA